MTPAQIQLAIRVAAGLAVALVLMIIFGLAVHSCAAPARQAAAQAHVQTVDANAQKAAGTDAVGVVVQQQANETAADNMTRDNHDKIVAAPGAAAPVDPGVNDAGIRALCLRRDYRSLPRCQQLLNPGPAGVAK